MNHSNRKTIQIREWKDLSPVSSQKEGSGYDETKQAYNDEEQNARFVLNDLHIAAKEDKALQQFLKNKRILTIRELKEGLEISSSSFIGVACFSEFRISVVPKILMSQSSLPKLIEYAYSDLQEIRFSEGEMDYLPDKYLKDILIRTLVTRVQKLLKGGLYKSYVEKQGDIPYLRGKLIVKDQLVHHLKGELVFSCQYDELEYDNLENQIIFFTLKNVCYSLTEDEQLKKDIRILLLQMEGLVYATRIELGDFERLSYSRLNQHYKKSHQLCKLILQSSGIGDFYTEKVSFVNSFFVDMNKIFESFVTNLFKQVCHRVESQKGKKAWQSDNGHAYGFRPDILVYDNHEKMPDIIDAKYKPEVLEGDMYQMGFYIHEYGGGHGFLVLPGSENYNYDLTSKSQGIEIHVRHLDVDKVVNLLYGKGKSTHEQLREEVYKLVRR